MHSFHRWETQLLHLDMWWASSSCVVLGISDVQSLRLSFRDISFVWLSSVWKPPARLNTLVQFQFCFARSACCFVWENILSCAANTNGSPFWFSFGEFFERTIIPQVTKKWTNLSFYNWNEQIVEFEFITKHCCKRDFKVHLPRSYSSVELWSHSNILY
jgi:hypothetical protein